MAFVDDFILTTPQVSGYRLQLSNAGAVESRMFAHYVAYAGWEEFNNTHTWLHELDNSFFPTPEANPPPRSEQTQWQYVLVFQYLGSELGLWRRNLPSPQVYPCPERQKMIRNLVRCQFLAFQQAPGLTFLASLDAIMVNRLDLPQITRLCVLHEGNSRSQQIAEFLELVVSIHGSRSDREGYYDDFAEAVGRLFNDNDPEDFLQIWFHPFLWTFTDARYFYSKIADGPEEIYEPILEVLESPWIEEVGRDYTSRRGAMYNRPEIGWENLTNNAYHFSVFTRANLNHLHQQFENHEEFEVEVLDDFESFWPTFAVDANQLLLTNRVDIWNTLSEVALLCGIVVEQDGFDE